MQDLGQKLSAAVDLTQIQEIAVKSLEQNLKAETWLYLPEDPAQPMADGSVALSGKERISADWSYKNRQPSGRFTQTLTESDWWFLPVLASKQCLGVIGLKFPADLKLLPTEQKRLAEAMIEYIADRKSVV